MAIACLVLRVCWTLVTNSLKTEFPCLVLELLCNGQVLSYSYNGVKGLDNVVQNDCSRVVSNCLLDVQSVQTALTGRKGHWFILSNSSWGD